MYQRSIKVTQIGIFKRRVSHQSNHILFGGGWGWGEGVVNTTVIRQGRLNL